MGENAWMLLKLPAAGRRVRGVSLIEALVAMVVMLIGLLGLTSLTINSVRFADESNLRSTAVNAAYDIADRMRANVVVRGRYVANFASKPVATTDCAATFCEESELATWDLAQWKDGLETALPSGQGQIENMGPTRMKITVRWTEREITRQYELEVAFRT